MKEFILTKNRDFTFSGCENCEALCCNGKFGTIYSQIILEEFEKVYKNFPILFIFGELDFIKPVVLLTNGDHSCPYLEDYRCSIYQNRPTVCRTYPLSPNLDNQIYIDVTCPEVNKSNSYIIKDNKVLKNFHDEIFEDYQNKYIDTHFEFEKLKKEEFETILDIKNISFSKFTGISSSKYIDMHLKSLKNLDKFLSN